MTNTIVCDIIKVHNKYLWRVKNMRLGRNDKCWCGSRKKYKDCCYENDMKKPIPKNNNVNYNNVPKFQYCMKSGKWGKTSRFTPII
jgi:hypothetical protein